ncbi:hypothetical protein [Nonomuraea rubra]|uniref:hypothetical protein n=1 Tax=Nonomuraea rubra TaxID=46180 RepID=UPI0034019BE6
MELVAAWLAVVWAAAPLAPVAGSGLAVAVPLVVVAVGAALVELERHGAGVAGLSLTAVALWGFGVTAWGVGSGTALVVSGLAVLSLTSWPMGGSAPSRLTGGEGKRFTAGSRNS